MNRSRSVGTINAQVYCLTPTERRDTAHQSCCSKFATPRRQKVKQYFSVVPLV